MLSPPAHALVVGMLWSLLLVCSPRTAAAAAGSSSSSSSSRNSSCPSGYQIRGRCVPSGVSPLDYYVNHCPDVGLPSPRITQTFTSSVGGCQVVVLNFTSQRWLTEAEFKPTSAAKATWTHQLIVVEPPPAAAAAGGGKTAATMAPTGWLWITGGHNPDSAPVAADDSETAVACALARSAHTVGAVLHQVPNQPVQFAHDIPHSSQNYPNEERTEDGIISYTWNHFCFNDSTAPEWLLRLPMTKAASRAMDVLQARYPQLHSFVVGGASKRGWTTWTTGLVEKRTKAIVPVVMDLLNLANGDVAVMMMHGTIPRLSTPLMPPPNGTHSHLRHHAFRPLARA
jgi:PhoPQ-activated pathogenicity-related protein